MSTNQPKLSPWDKNKPPNKTKKSRQSVNTAGSCSSQSGELKFKEVQIKLQSAIEKHLKLYESSSDEDELDSADVLNKILNKYNENGGTNDNTIKTQTFIQEAFFSGANTCLICISRVKRDDKIWNCLNCFEAFHLNCIQRWSKDTVVQQKQRIESQITPQEKKLFWCCPKCRSEYVPEQYPSKYYCFCGQTEDPKYQPFLIPHSCGEICRKNLLPLCGHKCLLLCHPGPCPPCPVTVNATCHCSSQTTTRRCSNRGWSCGNRCGKELSCGKHRCNDPCHLGNCPSCGKKSIQKCLCGTQQKLRDCSSPIWQCEKVCGKPLDCGNHTCQEVCHEGVCKSCPLTKPRSCPCGKSMYILPCTAETPSCGSTCSKILECGLHTCNYRCHKDKCGVCLETVTKSCRCGQHSKEIHCSKPYLCEAKCKKMRDCNKHPCNRKCCDGNCPPCEKPCGNTLHCGNHKCPSACHRGPCYPCQQTRQVSCRCGATKILAPCGRKYKIKAPKCPKLCLIPPDCHHEKRVKHRCHFGDCPPCQQICNKARTNCKHLCSAICHSAVLVKIEAQKASMPWEQTTPQLEKRNKPCPDCNVPVKVTCLGGHEAVDWPCYIAKPSSCGRLCGRVLACTNHTCALVCHAVENTNDVQASSNCESCESPCIKPRPEGCTHPCPRPCHSGDCAPCKQMLRIKCHCSLGHCYIRCSDWLNLGKREELQSCGNQCPKNYKCGHRCKAICHSGGCPNEDSCKKKVKVSCKCKRFKKEFQCETVRNGLAVVDCVEICLQKQTEEKKKAEAEKEIRLNEEKIKNQKELEEYQKKFSGKKKIKEKRMFGQEEDSSFVKKYFLILLSAILIATSVVLYHLV